MLNYILRRLLSLILVLLGVSFLVFAIGKVTPGDPVQMMLGSRATPDNVARLREELHLNDPLPLQKGEVLAKDNCTRSPVKRCTTQLLNA